ncbi:MAG: site-specific DNA-methyltransferase [Yaniella sp.]|nr:site-specific DNA-methyltransferase [Yaniella sp.]
MSGKSQKLELTWFNKDKALIPTETGKYGYDWVAPEDPRYCETHTLIFDEVVRGARRPKDEGAVYSERADIEPTNDNLLIQGESGDVLEALVRVPELAENYLGKVKCIYIDPPFNTAQTFADYEDNLEHSIWLTMMRDRLIHLRKLLSDDGSIWVHLDNVENHRMRVLMDEVFGAGNFVAEVVWQKTYSGRNDSKGIPSVTDTITVYRKTDRFSPNMLPRTLEMDARYKNPDKDPRGPWKAGDSAAPGASTHQGMVYAIQHPITGKMMYPAAGRHWSQGQQDVLKALNEWANYRLVDLNDEEHRASLCGVPVSEVRASVKAIVLRESLESAAEKVLTRVAQNSWPDWYFTAGGKGGLARKVFPSDRGRVPTNLLLWEEVGHTDTAAKEIRALFPGQSAFSTPKPERLIERIIHIATAPQDIVLDVFAGSGTTAAVAHKLGRRWVTCELMHGTIDRFTRPRLEKVVHDQDTGGITLTKGERVDDTEDGLPDGVSAEEAQRLTSLINKSIKNEPMLKKDTGIRALKSLVKTRRSTDIVNWRGGGGFTMAHLSPSCFDYDPELDLVTLTEAASGRTLVESVAANLNFRLTPEERYYDGVRGLMRLAVVEGRLDKNKVDDLVNHLPKDDGLTIAATEIEDGVRQYIRSLGRGCRAMHIPSDIFTYRASEEN